MNRSNIYMFFCFIITLLAVSTKASTVAYWRFEQGPANSAAIKEFPFLDISGNGNHLDPWSTGGNDGSVYRNNTAYNPVPRTKETNLFSIQNSGPSPSIMTRSLNRSYGNGSFPTGIDIETITPAKFTIEAFFKPESNGKYRTIVGRDAINIADSKPESAALYLQIRPDDGVNITFVDVSGFRHKAMSPANLITGFDWASDTLGENGRWYYAAAVSDGQKLSLYLANLTAGTDLVQVAQTDLSATGSPNTSLAKGTTNGTDWHSGGWSVARGLFDGNHTDRMYGFVDEIRISDSALSTSQLLINPKPTVDHNPIMYAADPHMVIINNRAWIYPTSGFYRHTFAYSSFDMVNWQKYGPILNFDNIPWIPEGKHCWAPGMIKKGSRYYLYYSVGPKPSHIGVAYAVSPTGTFVDKGSPLLSDNNVWWFEAIDPMAFTDPQTDKSYLYAGGSAGSTLRVFELNDDMISFAREITVDNPPEFTEGAFMHYRNGTYYLSYSHGYWLDQTYSVHYCTSNSPTGPWNYRGRILSSDTWFKGPGHHSIAYNNATDQWYITYHRWNNKLESGPYDGERSVAIDILEYDNNGLIKPVKQTDSGIGPIWLGNDYIADFVLDGIVDYNDLAYMSSVWLTNDSTADIAPVGGDNFVDMFDLATFISEHWMKEPAH